LTDPGRDIAGNAGSVAGAVAANAIRAESTRALLLARTRLTRGLARVGLTETRAARSAVAARPPAVGSTP
jgi:hypothetical protein